MKQKNKILIIVYLLIFSLFTSCLSIPSSAVSTGPRTLIINDVTVSATDTDNGFTSWYCVDYVYGRNVLVEVGYFYKNGNQYGFVLYDGGYVGELAYFSRDGLNYRWDWGTNTQYSFVIKPDGTGLYYDFSTSKDGTAKPRDVYKAYKR